LCALILLFDKVWILFSFPLYSIVFRFLWFRGVIVHKGIPLRPLASLEFCEFISDVVCDECFESVNPNSTSIFMIALESISLSPSCSRSWFLVDSSQVILSWNCLIGANPDDPASSLENSRSTFYEITYT
jgi:hypothetical protein